MKKAMIYVVGTLGAFGLLASLSACTPPGNNPPSPVDTDPAVQVVQLCGEVLLDQPCIEPAARPARGGAGVTTWYYYVSKGDLLRRILIKNCPKKRDDFHQPCIVIVYKDGKIIGDITILRPPGYDIQSALVAPPAS